MTPSGDAGADDARRADAHARATSRSSSRCGSPSCVTQIARDRARCLPAASHGRRRRQPAAPLGVVRVARTVLRLVLQNLIINAADAVRDAGKERGILRVSAEIVQRRRPPAAAPALPRRRRRHRRRESRARVRERILHQVPGNQPRHRTALVRECRSNALGGRIWAASDGPGRGAVDARAGAARRPRNRTARRSCLRSHD